MHPLSLAERGTGMVGVQGSVKAGGGRPQLGVFLNLISSIPFLTGLLCFCTVDLEPYTFIDWDVGVDSGGARDSPGEQSKTPDCHEDRVSSRRPCIT